MSAALDALAGDLLDRIAERPELLDQLAARLADRQAASPPEDRWLRGAQEIADYLGCSTSRIYSLSSSRRLPAEHDGAALVARASVLDEWVRSGGDRCPTGGR